MTLNTLKPKSTYVQDKKVLTQKWGQEIMECGFTAVPDILLKRMGKLGLKPMEMIVMLQIMTYWWTKDAAPWPSKKIIALAIGCNEKTVQKNVTRLEKLGFITREIRKKDAARNDSNVYRFDPLIALLEPEAKEDNALRKEKAEKKKENMTPAYKKNPTLKAVK